MGLITVIIYAGLFGVAIFALFFLIRGRIQGKLLAFFVEKDKTLKHFLFAPKGRFFKFAKEDEMYIIDPDCVLLVRYPFGMPKIVQQTIPCLVYARNNPKPLSPEEVSVVPKGLTAKQISSSVNENIIKGIVKGVEEETKVSRIPPWLLPGLSILLMVVLVVMMWSMNAKMTEIFNYIKVIGS